MKIFTISFIIMLSLCSLIFSQGNSVYDIDDSNYNELIAQSKDKWILLFYLPTCPHCKMAITNIEKINMTSIMTDQQLNMKIGKIDCNVASYTCVTFKIKTVPHVVKIDKGRMIVMMNYPSIESLNDFISSEHLESETDKVPEILGSIEFTIKIMQEGLQMFNVMMNSYLKNYGIDLEWSIGYSAGLFISLLLTLIGIEIAIIYCFCSAKNQNKPKNKIAEQKNVEEAKQTENVEEAKKESKTDTLMEEDNSTKLKEETKKEKEEVEEKTIIEKKNQ